MIDRYDWYRFAFPIRSRAQRELRRIRRDESQESFAQSLGNGPCRDAVASFLWDYIRGELAFVPDFKPGANDSFSKLHGLDPDELRDDVLAPLADRCGIDVTGIDFTGQDLSMIDTPADVNSLMSALVIKQQTGE